MIVPLFLMSQMSEISTTSIIAMMISMCNRVAYFLYCL